jgi:malonyl CoA-acyl carrier protein transacylase
MVVIMGLSQNSLEEVCAEKHPLWASSLGRTSMAESLIRQITSPVRWEEPMQTMSGLDLTVFIEVGPGIVLFGLAQRTAKESNVASFCGPAYLDAARKSLNCICT